MTHTATTYTRNFRGNWYRNGCFCPNPPDRVLALAKYMALECTVRIERKRRR